jgi:hypothetical protein
VYSCIYVTSSSVGIIHWCSDDCLVTTRCHGNAALLGQWVSRVCMYYCNVSVCMCMLPCVCVHIPFDLNVMRWTVTVNIVLMSNIHITLSTLSYTKHSNSV